MIQLVVPLIAFFYLLSQPNFTQAATPTCKPIFGGGVHCSATITPTASKAPANMQPNQQTITKGGLPVHSPSQTKRTPDTGPEMFGLVALIPAAGVGMWLRRKTRVV